MIKKFLLITHIIFISSISAHSIDGQMVEQRKQDPFVVVLMVKNEETSIKKTLEPFVEAGINAYVIFDTGSTDNTIEHAEHFFKSKAITDYYIFQEPFIDFAISRNRALDLAEECFPDITFLLFPDAEWYMHNVDDLKDFCHNNRGDDCTCYLVRIFNKNIDFYVPRLIRSKSNARFVGDIHEVVIANVVKKIPRDIFFELDASKAGLEKSKKRWESDLKKLLKRYEENPDDSRTTFYLAQTYECLCDFEQAYCYYEIRSKQAGSIEETYETFYRLGRVTDILSKNDERFTWHMAQDYYFIAHKMLPHRAEPLIKIAHHYWPESAHPENAALCYLFAKRAYDLPYPENDILFVDPEVYHYWTYELLSKSAWHVGDFKLGEICTRKALEYKELPHLLRNLACYVEINQMKSL